MTKSAVDFIREAVNKPGEEHPYEPLPVRIGNESVVVDIVTDGTHRGTLVKDHNTGKMIPTSEIHFDLNFDRKNEGLNLFNLTVVGACAINNVPAQMSYIVLHGCPNPECHYHAIGLFEQIENHSMTKLQPGLDVLAMKMAGIEKTVRQAKNRVWEIQWSRESSEGQEAENKLVNDARAFLRQAIALAEETIATLEES